MKTLTCKDMGKPDCDFVAKGETEEEVLNTMFNHVREAHEDVLENNSESDLREQMRSNMSEE